jgi:hypothetical protein
MASEVPLLSHATAKGLADIARHVIECQILLATS